MTEINRYLLKITGSIELDKDIDAKQDAIVNMPVSVYSVEYKNTQHDGTLDKCFKAKVCGAVDIRQTEKTIHGKDKNSESKKTRDFIYWTGQGLQIVDTEEFYKLISQKFRSDSKYIDAIIADCGEEIINLLR
jgi:hypothetical protein